MTIFKHNKHIQKEFERLNDLINYTPVSKPVANKKNYSGSFVDSDGKTVAVENGQVKSKSS